VACTRKEKNDFELYKNIMEVSNYVFVNLIHFLHQARHSPGTHIKTRGVRHCGRAIDIKKYLKAKEESWKLKYFTMQKCNLQKTL
jgi:hypothetical protein